MPLVSEVYAPEIWAIESLMVLRNNLVMARLIHRNFENVVRQVGDTIQTRKPRKLTAHTWAGQTGTSAISTIEVDNLNADNLTITLDTLKYTAFLVEDRDASFSIKDLRDEFLVPAMDPLAEAVDDDIMSEITSAASSDVEGNALSAIAYDTVGLGADMNEDDIVQALETLKTAQCPAMNLRLVLSTEHEGDCLRSDTFHRADMSGSTEALRNANLGRKFSFDVYATQNVPTALDTDSTPQSLAFHPNVCALVTRPLVQPPANYGVASAVKAIDQIGLRVTSTYDINKKGVVVSFDVLYGVQLLDANLGCIVNP